MKIRTFLLVFLVPFVAAFVSVASSPPAFPSRVQQQSPPGHPPLGDCGQDQSQQEFDDAMRELAESQSPPCEITPANLWCVFGCDDGFVSNMNLAATILQWDARCADAHGSYDSAVKEADQAWYNCREKGGTNCNYEHYVSVQAAYQASASTVADIQAEQETVIEDNLEAHQACLNNCCD